MKHKKVRLTELEKALMGKGFVQSHSHPMSPRQCDVFADALRDGKSLRQATRASRRVSK